MGGAGAQGYEGQNYAGAQDDDDEDNDGAGKGKRRSKNDVEGRDFKCSYCPKTYLSYPALYTHIKQKHSKGPDGEVRAPPTSGRGRGRPRKNVSKVWRQYQITVKLISSVFIFSPTIERILRKRHTSSKTIRRVDPRILSCGSMTTMKPF